MALCTSEEPLMETREPVHIEHAQPRDTGGTRRRLLAEPGRVDVNAVFSDMPRS
jgi:hypothetical protein